MLKLSIVLLIIVWTLTGCSVTIVQPPALVIHQPVAKATIAHCSADAKLPPAPVAPKPPVVSESDPVALADALALYALQLKKTQRAYNAQVETAFKHYVETCGVK